MPTELPAIVVEVCVGSTADVAAAAAAGADRVELCGSLELGGLTPSIGAVETILEKCPLPAVIMVRPRAGGFHYDRDEFAAMLADTERFVKAGASGIAFGIVNRHGRIDTPRVREMIDRIGAGQAVFHRAFDFVADWRVGLDELIRLGFHRVLTSGGQATAAAGSATLLTMIEAAGERIEVMPGGGIRAENVVQLVENTRCRQVHLGAALPADDGSLAGNQEINLNDRRFLSGTTYRAVDSKALSATIVAVRTRPNSRPGED